MNINYTDLGNGVRSYFSPGVGEIILTTMQGESVNVVRLDADTFRNLIEFARTTNLIIWEDTETSAYREAAVRTGWKQIAPDGFVYDGYRNKSTTTGVVGPIYDTWKDCCEGERIAVPAVAA